MAEKVSLIFDNEYVIMSEVAENENITQRELSKKLGISLSTVNVLMNKMIREGLIKMTQVSQKQVLYMLTPIGMMEKAKKTVVYLKAHYRAIYETKEKIKSIINNFDNDKDIIYVHIRNDEMGEILSLAVHEYKSMYSKSNIKLIYSINDIDLGDYESSILLHMNENDKDIVAYGDMKNLRIINLTELL